MAGFAHRRQLVENVNVPLNLFSIVRFCLSSTSISQA